MDAILIIAAAVKCILGEQYELPEDEDDKYFLGNIIIRFSEVLLQDGPPTIESINKSIEIGELTPDKCRNGYISLRSYDQSRRRTAESLRFIANRLHINDPDEDEIPKPSDFGRWFAFDVCQACPAFIEAIHKVHTSGFTSDTILERAKAYWIATYGFWA